ncbi:uncharacterized protein LOC114077679 isoform X2 [Solanum pennellii]|uniref:Uncharacterized protein LOC114077679 isoform X2 n=1 Tax=Solanum pennellii TaxID=28526 RepID=A0ABM1VDW1_SOLPN|nr:uncharacterized protein LOC114077679 isoform X2 [Solanum pennellii]
MMNSSTTHPYGRTLVPSWKYCMLGYYVDAPVDWYYEECDIGKGRMSSSSGLENLPYEGSKLHASQKICQSTVQPKKHSEFPGGQRINWEKEVRTGTMRYLHVEEALDLSSNIKKYESPLIDTVSSRVVLTKFMATMTQGIFSKIHLLLYFHPIDVAYFLCLNGSTSLEQRSPDIVNKSRMMNSSMTHPCDPALVPSQKYCMLGNYVDAPVDWCCEECDIGKGRISSSSGLENLHYEGSNLHASQKLCQSTVQPKKHSKFPRGHCINWEKEVRTGKIRYLLVEEAPSPSSSIMKYGSPLIDTTSSRVVITKSIATMTRGLNSSASLEQRSPDVVNKSRMMNSSMTHPCDPALVPSQKYCMLGYYLDAPADWCYEECDIGKGRMSSSSGLENLHYEGSKLHASQKICQSTVQPKKHSKFPGGHRINWKKEVRTGKMRYLPVEEAPGLSSIMKTYGSPLIDTVSSRVVLTKSIETVTRGIFSKIYLLPSFNPIDVAYFLGLNGSTILEQRSHDIVNKCRMMNMTHPCDSALVSSQKYSMWRYYVDAPVDWCCEECDIENGEMSSSRGLKNLPYEGSKLHASEKICQSTVQPKKHSKFPGEHHINWEKEVRTGKMRYLHVEEALDLSSNIKKYESPLINTVSSRAVLTEFMATMTQGIFSKIYLLLYFHPIDVAYFLSLNGSTSLDQRSPDIVNKSRMMNSSMTHPCGPALVPSQKGSFDILGDLEIVVGMLNNCIQAHTPRVRRKVYEFSGLLPDTLKFELVLRGDIWESIFNNHIPSKEDI